MAHDRAPTPPDRLAEALARLRPLEREVLRLASEGLTNPEIAERLDLSAERVERLLARALASLDRLLEDGDRSWWKLW